MKKIRRVVLVCKVIALCCCVSCSAPNYLPAPVIDYPVIENLCTFGVQNMDGDAKVENDVLTCHYEGFDVTYNIIENQSDIGVTSLLYIKKVKGPLFKVYKDVGKVKIADKK